MKQIIKSGFTVLLLLLAISCKKENSISPSLAVNSNSSTEELLTNIDGAAAAPVKIGTQKWMATNLSVTRYRNGDKIPQVKNPVAWAGLTTGAWCWYNNDPANDSVYGKLYNWYAVNDSRGLAPTGYHIPSDAEWTTLSTFLGGDAITGSKMKEAGTAHWLPPNTDATNSSGFTGLPGGYRNPSGTFISIGFNGFWWSSTEGDTSYAWYRILYYNNGYIIKYNFYKIDGFSVRCVKD